MATEIRPYTERLHKWLPGRNVSRLQNKDEAEKAFLSSRSSVDESGGEEPLALLPVRKRSWGRSCLSVGGIACIVFLGMMAFAVLVRDSRSGKVPDSRPPQTQGGSIVTAHCGTTPEEAQARGCIWDIMSFGWMHPSCFDYEESAQWETQYGPWEWYSERPGNATDLIPLTAEELPYTPVVWTTQGYHVQHCLYVLKMIHVAAMAGEAVSNEGIELSHTAHCTKLIGDPELVEYAEVNTRVHLLFVQCVTLT